MPLIFHGLCLGILCGFRRWLECGLMTELGGRGACLSIRETGGRSNRRQGPGGRFRSSACDGWRSGSTPPRRRSPFAGRVWLAGGRTGPCRSSPAWPPKARSPPSPPSGIPRSSTTPARPRRPSVVVAYVRHSRVALFSDAARMHAWGASDAPPDRCSPGRTERRHVRHNRGRNRSESSF